MKRLSILFLISYSLNCTGQNNLPYDTLRKSYDAEMRNSSSIFSSYFYPNRQAIYSLNEDRFIREMDSLKSLFLEICQKYANQFETNNKTFIPSEIKDITYFFDRQIVDYPYFHENFTGNKTTLSKTIQARLNQHFSDFNNPLLLSSTDFKGYVEAVLRHQTSVEIKKEIYKKSDNKRLDAYLNLIPIYFRNRDCIEFWQHHYLFNHLDNFGSKNIERVIKTFLSTCKNTAYTHAIDSIYKDSRAGYKGHLIKTYKKENGFSLDLHIFLPDSSFQKAKRPAIVYFHGGSWTEGTPEWDFYNCGNYAKKGWVAIAVEYRISDRHETSPFESVKDARSAIRWLRENAEMLNIDTNRIVASGNSAGGHLVLTTALSNQVNEKTDDLKYSPIPNLLLVNAGVYNLYADGSTEWISRGQKDKNTVKLISPQHLLRPGLPPLLVVHGTNDQSVNYSTAKTFADEVQKTNTNFEFHTLEGAPHYIWYDRRFSGKLAEIRKSFLRKYGYE